MIDNPFLTPQDKFNRTRPLYEKGGGNKAYIPSITGTHHLKNF